jgi:hypothetical protein
VSDRFYEFSALMKPDPVTLKSYVEVRDCVNLNI